MDEGQIIERNTPQESSATRKANAAWIPLQDPGALDRRPSPTMPASATMTSASPRDGGQHSARAGRSMFDLFSSISEGMLLVDRDGPHGVAQRRLRALPAGAGLFAADQAVGQGVEDVVPNTLMRRVLETGQPILMDLLTNRAGTFVVSRLPVRDGTNSRRADRDRDRAVRPSGDDAAAADQQVREPAAGPGPRPARQLASQRRTKYTLASFVGGSAAAVEVSARRGARRCRPARCCCWAKPAPARNCWRMRSHAASARATGPFVSVNIAAVPDTLLEAEFFGVAPGAFTGADRRGRDGQVQAGRRRHAVPRRNRRHAAQPAAQAAARAARGGDRAARLEQGDRLRCPGDRRDRRATCRRSCARASSARICIYRLNVLPIRVPPLRERRSDIPALVEVLAEDMALRSGSAPPELSAQAVALLSAQTWRGNIRELRNVLEQAAMRSDTQHIEARHLEEVLRESGIQPIARGMAAPTALRRAVRPGAATLGRAGRRNRAQGDRGGAGRHRRQQGRGRQTARHFPGQAL